MTPALYTLSRPGIALANHHDKRTARRLAEQMATDLGEAIYIHRRGLLIDIVARIT